MLMSVPGRKEHGNQAGIQGPRKSDKDGCPKPRAHPRATPEHTEQRECHLHKHLNRASRARRAVSKSFSHCNKPSARVKRDSNHPHKQLGHSRIPSNTTFTTVHVNSNIIKPDSHSERATADTLLRSAARLYFPRPCHRCTSMWVQLTTILKLGYY